MSDWMSAADFLARASSRLSCQMRTRAWSCVAARFASQKRWRSCRARTIVCRRVAASSSPPSGRGARRGAAAAAAPAAARLRGGPRRAVLRCAVRGRRARVRAVVVLGVRGVVRSGLVLGVRSGRCDDGAWVDANRRPVVAARCSLGLGCAGGGMCQPHP